MTFKTKEFRARHGLSREQLAALLGVSMYTVARREKAERAGKEPPQTWTYALERLGQKMQHRRDLVVFDGHLD